MPPPAGVAQLLSPRKNLVASGVPVADKSEVTLRVAATTGVINVPASKVTVSASLTGSMPVAGSVAILKVEKG